MLAALGIAALLISPLPIHGAIGRAGATSAVPHSNGVSPPPTVGAAAAFDTADGYALMFGGLDPAGKVVPWTWSFVHSNWTNLTSAVGPAPSARWGEGLAYDPVAGYVLLFGGCLNLACTLVSNQTWGYAHDSWTNLTGNQPTPPPGRGRTMMTYDPTDGYVFLFGGTGTGSTLLNDEWGFASGRWSKVGNVSSPTPSPRFGASMAYDPATTSVVLFGGGGSSAASMGDTWSYHAGNWTNLTATDRPAPSPRRLAPMTYDSGDGYLLLVNGYNASYLRSEWTFGPTGWTQLNAPGGPEASFGAVLVDDPVDHYVVYFSGAVSAGVLTSTLVYADGTWTLLINPTYSHLTEFGLLLILGTIILVPTLVAGLVGNRHRRNQERRLGEGFQLRPGEIPGWFPSGPALRSRVIQQLGILVVVFVVFVPVLALSFADGSPQAAVASAIVLALVFGVFIAVVAWTSLGQLPRSIGVVPAGVILDRRVGELRVPWSQLQPGVVPPRRGWFNFHYVLPGSEAIMRGFSATIPQVRGILASPYAPAWVIPPAVAAGLGMPPRAGGTPGAGAPSGAALPGLWSAATPPVPGVPPTPATARAGGDPPAAAGPRGEPPLAAVSTPRGPPRLPPGAIACPRCGQVNRVERVAFCTACGTRLR